MQMYLVWEVLKIDLLRKNIILTLKRDARRLSDIVNEPLINNNSNQHPIIFI